MKDMRKKGRRILVSFGIFVLAALTLAGCGNNAGMATKGGASVSTGGKPTPTVEAAKKNPIKIEDIKWSVTEGIIDGKKIVSFNYTNNSKYTITDVEMKFVQKEGTTAEQLKVFDKFKTDLKWSDEEIAKIYIKGYNRKFADPGETVADSPCDINGTYTRVENMAQYELMEPDTVSIAYIGDDDKMYMMYYDFKSQKYGESTKGGLDIYQWSDSKISSLLPKADLRVVKVSTDKDDRFLFSAFGVSREEYEAYVEACKEKGFTKVAFSGDSSYRASNADGYEARITYKAVEETMTGSIEKK